ncbi:MAG TPA: pectinesterase family protein [Polyangiaceae bacterium]|nr:pectinesterase family protein [Polyangiaceae bacterium]
MNGSRRSLGWVKLLSLGCAGLPLLVACGEDNPSGGADTMPTAGSATSGGQPTGTAGAAPVGTAGSANNAAGTSVSAGAGSGGADSTAGAAGSTSQAGAAPTAGAAGSGNNGGAGGSSAGSGAGGSSGSAGTGGGGSAPDCNSVTGQPVVTVGASGANFTTIQAALNSLSKTNTTLTQIRIAPGTYKEKLQIQVPNITLCGQTGKAASTILTYSDNANTPNGNGGTLGTTGGASTTLSASNVSAENLTFANSTPQGGSQAVALLVTGDQVQFRNSRFISFQDTLYVRKAKQYFRDSYIEGTVDFIFGDATAVFQDCTVHNVSGGTAVTAPNTAQNVAYGLVFLGGKLTAASAVGKASMALGRNWGAYGAAAFLKTELGAHIKPVGWVPMGENTLDTARFSEYQTTGDGATPSAISARAPQSKQLSAAEAGNYTLAKIFGNWVPSYSK